MNMNLEIQPLSITNMLPRRSKWNFLSIVLKKMDKMNLFTSLIFTAKIIYYRIQLSSLIMNPSLRFRPSSKILADNHAFKVGLFNVLLNIFFI